MCFGIETIGVRSNAGAVPWCLRYLLLVTCECFLFFTPFFSLFVLAAPVMSPADVLALQLQCTIYLPHGSFYRVFCGDVKRFFSGP